MGDAVLERNVCFVDVSASTGIQPIIEYMVQQLQSGMMSASSGSGDFLGLLSGRGGAQVDVILYLVTNGKMRHTAAKKLLTWFRYFTSGLRADQTTL